MHTETRSDSTYFFLVKAQELAGEIGQDSLLAEVKNTYAYFLKSRGKFDEGIQLLKENVQYAKRENDSFLLMRTYMSMGDVYFPDLVVDYNLDTLIFYTKKGLIMAEQRADTLHTLIAKMNLSGYYQKKPQLRKKALSLLLESIELTDHHPEGKYFKSPGYRDLANFYLEDKSYQKAIEALELSIEHGATYESYGSLLLAYQTLKDVYKTIGDYKNAADAYEGIFYYSEKLNNQEVEKQVAALEVEFEAERKASEIAELQLLNQAASERSRRQQLLLLTLLVGGLLIGGLAYLAFRNNRKKQQALLKLAANQKELAQFKTRFYTNLTHEFRTPLTVIQGMANRILGNPESKAMILRNSQSLLILVNQMLDLQKLDAKALPTNWVQGDIIAYLRYLAEPFVVLAKDKNIHLTIYDENPVLQMDFDTNHIKQMLDNLLSNAVKFTPADGEILLHLQQVDDHLQIKVKDNGIGIPTNQQVAIFDRFYQTNPTNRQQSTGTGIGLALAKELIELMDGTIKVESAPNKGTTFTVLLPIINNAPLLTVQQLRSAQNLPAILEKDTVSSAFQSPVHLKIDVPKVLIIEDNADVLKFLALTLKDNYELSTARDGQAGLTQALETIPDLIISDIMMPIMDGLEVCKRLKTDERTSHIPVILLTAKASKANQLEGLTEGADVYLTKPFDPQELLIRIDKLLENRRKLQAYYLQWNPFKPSKQVQPTKESAFLLKVKHIIEQQLSDENFGVLQLCHALHLSRMQVHRKLKAVCDKSTAQFIRELRLQKAHQLLKTTDLTVAEVAYSVGFADPNYFSKAFLAFFGYLPSVTHK